MNKISVPHMAYRGFLNLATKQPEVVSFEVTHSCPADCLHCDKGRLKHENNLMQPEDFYRVSRELRPAFCQLSGGEPLTRDDLEEVAAAIKRPGGVPFTICVTNGWYLTEERYLSLLEAGVNFFSISLDFPDGRHDEFRQLPGLYERLQGLIPYLTQRYGRKNIVLNSAITHANFSAIPDLVRRAEEWGVGISFSAYSSLRTGDEGYLIRDSSDLAVLRRHFDFLVQHRRRANTVTNSPYVLEQTYRYFAEGGLSGCRAGERFCVVRPEGFLNACSMFPEHVYDSVPEMQADFSRENRCDQCYVAIRALTERPLAYAIWDNFAAYFRLPRGDGSP